MEIEEKLKKLDAQLSKVNKKISAEDAKLKNFKAEKKGIQADIETLKNERLICEVKARGMTADEAVEFLRQQKSAGQAEQEVQE